MNGSILLLGGTALFLLAYFLYAKKVGKILGIDDARPTPAHTQNDGIDYVPAPAPVLFGHHFASIAGAGPIVGPILASEFGWASVALWVILGCIFIGAAHDFMTLFLSVRHEGKSIATVIDDVVGRPARIGFLIFCWVALILVCAEFTRLVAVTFTARPQVATSSLLFIFEAVIFGLCVYRAKMSLLYASIVFVAVMFSFVWVGMLIPCDLQKMFSLTAQSAQSVWTIILLVYCFLASTLPVWILLQPRDYLNSYLLYAMMFIGIGAVVVAPFLAGGAAVAMHLPAFSGITLQGGAREGLSLFPFLFVTVACGACSGFHALVASGTTAKQIDRERHIRPVAYGGMLLEGVLALLALIAVATLAPADFAEKVTTNAKPNAVMIFASGIAAICGKIGLSATVAENFFSLAIAAFLMTSVDTATRLGRFVTQELVQAMKPCHQGEMPIVGGKKSFCENMYFTTGIVVGIVAVLLLGNPQMATNLWTLFASANQMLAALTLLTVSMWLLKNGRSIWISLIPMGVMLVTSGTAVFQLFVAFLKKWLAAGFAAGGTVTIGAGILFLLSITLVILCGVRVYRMVFFKMRKAAMNPAGKGGSLK